MTEMDPFEIHPEIKSVNKKEEKILSILRTESERISRESIPTWGWTTNDLLEVIDNIEEGINKL